VLHVVQPPLWQIAQVAVAEVLVAKFLFVFAANIEDPVDLTGNAKFKFAAMLAVEIQVPVLGSSWHWVEYPESGAGNQVPLLQTRVICMEPQVAPQDATGEV
jgi:hypothetical protein